MIGSLHGSPLRPGLSCKSASVLKTLFTGDVLINTLDVSGSMVTSTQARELTSASEGTLMQTVPAGAVIVIITVTACHCDDNKESDCRDGVIYMMTRPNQYQS